MPVDVSNNWVSNKWSPQTNVKDSISKLCNSLIIYLFDIVRELVHGVRYGGGLEVGHGSSQEVSDHLAMQFIEELWVELEDGMDSNAELAGNEDHYVYFVVVRVCVVIAVYPMI